MGKSISEVEREGEAVVFEKNPMIRFDALCRARNPLPSKNRGCRCSH